MSRGRQSGAESTNGRFWREVPKLNLLVVERRRPMGRLLVRASLAVAILAVGYGGLYLSQQRDAAQDEKGPLQARQLTLQAQITDRNNALEDLRSQITAAQAELELTRESARLLTEGSGNWFNALTALFNAQVEGIQLTSISNPDPQVVEATGTATSSNAIARFRARIGASAPLLLLQGMTVEEDSEGQLTFSARVQIGQ